MLMLNLLFRMMRDGGAQTRPRQARPRLRWRASASTTRWRPRRNPPQSSWWLPSSSAATTRLTILTSVRKYRRLVPFPSKAEEAQKAIHYHLRKVDVDAWGRARVTARNYSPKVASPKLRPQQLVSGSYGLLSGLPIDFRDVINLKNSYSWKESTPLALWCKCWTSQHNSSKRWTFCFSYSIFRFCAQKNATKKESDLVLKFLNPIQNCVVVHNFLSSYLYPYNDMITHSLFK